MLILIEKILINISQEMTLTYILIIINKKNNVN